MQTLFSPICVIFFLLCFSTTQAYTDGALYRENFELGEPSWVASKSDLKIQSYTTGGIDGKIMKAVYRPDSRGSPRLTSRMSFDGVESATLSFDFKLHSQFEFVKGGKMHGLAGGSATTGCKDVDPKGWSVRMMWRREGEVEAYVYHQNRENRCGDSYKSNFKLRRGTWYRVDLQVRMNTGRNIADGRVRLYIDGKKLIEVNDLILTGDESVQIDKMLFSTFYGGSDSTWSPSKTTYVYYDNFTVHGGQRVTGARGTDCEIFQEGIVHRSGKVCCAQSCGSCGGRGCGSLPGGSQSCCYGRVRDSTNICDGTTSNAPCKYS